MSDIQPFEIAATDDALDDLRRRLRGTRWPNEEPVDDWSQGTPLAYLKERGVDGATAKRFGIGYAPDGWSGLIDKFGGSQEALERLLATGLVIRKDNGRHYDRFRDRIMFPIRDARGRCIAFGGRAMGDGEPKYLNSPETVLFHKGRELYGLYEARQALRHIDRLVVVAVPSVATAKLMPLRASATTSM